MPLNQAFAADAVTNPGGIHLDCAALPPAEADLVRAENLVHGSDQQICSTGRLAVMITGHVPGGSCSS